MDIKAAIASVIRTLGTVEVKGRANLDHLLSSIIMLEQLMADIERGDADAADEHH